MPTKKKVPKKRSKKAENRELDEMWKEKVKQRDEYFCCVCNKKVEGKNCHAHHILPKGISRTRWDAKNGITLCYRHHKVGNFSAHNNAIWFTFWLKTNRPKQFNFIVSEIQRLATEPQHFAEIKKVSKGGRKPKVKE